MIKLPKKLQPLMMKKHTQKRMMGLGDQRASTRRYTTYRRLRAQMSHQHKMDASSIAFWVGNGFAQVLLTHAHFGGSSFVATYKRCYLALLMFFFFLFFFLIFAF